MRSFFFFCFAVLILNISSCKETASQQQDETAVENNNTTVPSGSTSNVSGGHDQTFLTDQLFHFTASNTVGEKNDLYAGQWIDLMPDGTYKAGKQKDQTHTGHWDYNAEQKIILLRPDDNKFKISEWNVMHNNDMVVWVGTQTYGNNATQIQLKRSQNMPN